MTTLGPEVFHERLRNIFDSAAKPAYAQIATPSLSDFPGIRTLHVRYLPEKDCLAMSSHISSLKWKELRHHPYLSGCLFDHDDYVQTRWAGRTQLLSQSQEPAILEKMWSCIRPDVRKAYWLDHSNQHDLKSFDIQKHCPQHGVILCFPFLWEIFEMNTADYTQSQRWVFKLQDDHWTQEPISLLHNS